jgi:hypothetical protein
MPLSHFHYDRFDTPDDEEDGKFSLNFRTNPMGEIEGVEISLDEAAVTFIRRVPPALSSDATLQMYAGTYRISQWWKDRAHVSAGKGPFDSRRPGPSALASATVPHQGVSGCCYLVQGRRRESARDATTRSEC